jgi:hypothetical protein
VENCHLFAWWQSCGATRSGAATPTLAIFIPIPHSAEIEDIQQSVSHSVSLSVGKSSKQKFNLKSYYIFCIIQRHQQKGAGVSLYAKRYVPHSAWEIRGKKRRSLSFSGAEMWERVRAKRETLGGLIKNSWPESANKTNRKEKKQAAALR